MYKLSLFIFTLVLSHISPSLAQQRVEPPAPGVISTTNCTNATGTMTYKSELVGKGADKPFAKNTWTLNGEKVDNAMARIHPDSIGKLASRNFGPQYAAETYTMEASISILNQREGHVETDYLICEKFENR
jgi:hypothetical protein